MAPFITSHPDKRRSGPLDDTFPKYDITRIEADKADGPLPRRMSPSFSLSFLRSCGEGAVLVNPQGRVSFVNDAARAILSLPDLAGTPRAEWWDLFPAEMDTLLRHALSRVLEGEAVQIPALLPSRDSGAQEKWTILASPVVNSDSQVESVFSIIVPSAA